MDLFEYYDFVSFQLSKKELSKTEIDDMMPFERYIIAEGLIRHKEAENK